MALIFRIGRWIPNNISSLSFSRKLGFRSDVQMDPILGLDPVQVSLLNESCIAVDTKDRVIGSITKKNAHLLGSKKEFPPLHRAFSVFLFNSNNQLLLQQRAAAKITFPNCYTNTCCSHPSFTQEELNEENHEGIKRAARRRLEAELGIPQDAVELSDFHVLTRILYGASSNSIWGEHEIDYVIFLKKDLTLKPNPNEVSCVSYVSLDHFRDYLEDLQSRNVQLTPWFSLIVQHYLIDWWKNIDNVHNIEFDPTIHCL